MSFDTHQFGDSNILSLPGGISSESLFFSTQSNFLKDPTVQEVMLFKDSESEELVSVGDEVSGGADDLDLGYDTNSDLSSPMSAKSEWGEASTHSSAMESCKDEDLFADFEEDTKNSLISILDGDEEARLDEWNQSLSCQSKTPAINDPSPDHTSSSSLIDQVLNISATPVDFSALHGLLQSSSQGTLETSSPIQTAKPIRKRSAASLSTCGLTPRKKLRKSPSLLQTLPDKVNGTELQITVQPEKHHRARYRTEGSRGSVKDDSGDSYPKLKLVGVNQPVVLQIFVGTDQGKIRPHGYYQACKVTGRNTTPCEEKDVDGTTVLEVPWEPTEDKMEISVDCIGILKLRNADVEQRIGPVRSKRKSTCVRLVFRVLVPAADGSFEYLQSISRSITCTQPLGHPEILKKSMTQCSVAGGEELFIIGKNFTSKANTEVKLRQLDDDGKVTWEGDCEIDKTLFQNNHIVCKIPPYPNQNVKTQVTVYLVVTGKPNQCSDLEAHPIEYMPNPGAMLKTSVTCSNKVQDANFTSVSSSPVLNAVLPPTPTSPAANMLTTPVPSVQCQSTIKAEMTSPAPEPNEDEFALALQMMASAYLKNKDMYNTLLMQTQASGLFDNNNSQDKLLELLSEELALESRDCDVDKVYQVQTEGIAVVQPEAAAVADSQGLIYTVPTGHTHTIVSPEIADIYEYFASPDISDPQVLDDVLDVLSNN